MPTRLIHDEDGVSIIGDVPGDFDQMLVHGMRIAPWHDKGGGLAKFRADRTEDISGPCPLIMWSRWPCPSFGPPSGDLVLLADAGLVLESDFYSLAFGGAGGDRSHCGGKVFLNSSTAFGSCA